MIAYGGYSARLVYSAAWASELVDAKLGAADVGHVYAVKGPAQANYAAREIGNSKLRAHLATLDDTTAPIYAVAHSSGSFVAHELFQQLHSRDETATLARISCANLDGGGSSFTQAIAAELGARVRVRERSGCASGAGWCLHDVVITHRPHNPATFDLARDYVDFEDRPVTTEYLDLFVAE